MIKVRRLEIVDEVSVGERRPLALEPKGVGSWELEALTSLFCRTAERHWLMTVPFWNALTGTGLGATRARAQRDKRLTLQSMNGCGQCARYVSGLLRAAVGGNPARLTLLPWQGLLDPRGHGLLKSHLAWCPICWQEDREVGVPIYVRLLWVICPVSICPKHYMKLQTRCAKCGKDQNILPRVPRQSICRGCGADLMDVRRGRFQVFDMHGKDVWISSAVGALIKHTCAREENVPFGVFQAVLNTLAARYFDGSLENLANRCGIPNRMLRQWASGDTKPYLAALLEFAYRIQVPVDSMLLRGVGLTDPSSWRREGRPSFGKSFKKLSKDQLHELSKDLKATIGTTSGTVSSACEIARRHATTYNALRYHFPVEYRLLLERGRVGRVKQTKTCRIQRIKRVMHAAKTLASSGIYPSERALRAAPAVLSSDLRRPEISKILRKVRNDFLLGKYKRLYSDPVLEPMAQPVKRADCSSSHEEAGEVDPTKWPRP